MDDDDPAAVLCGLGGWVPPRVVTNDDLAARLDTSDEWIRTRTGIRRRHVIDAGMSTGTLAAEAGARALAGAGLDAVEGLVLATTTPDRPCPATAPDVAARLGLPGIAALDVNAVCSGFVYGLAVAAGLVGTGVLGTALVIGADAYSTILDPHDRTTVAIFGDGGGAVVLRRGTAAEPGAFGPFDLGSDGRSAELIMVPGGGSLSRAGGRPDAPGERFFTMAGKAVFRDAVLGMSESARRVLDRRGWPLESVDLVVGHQANARILTALAEQLGLPPERVHCAIEDVGNTAAASIPLALADAVARGVLRPGHRVLLTAFGGGLSWGSTVLTWPGTDPWCGPEPTDPPTGS